MRELDFFEIVDADRIGMSFPRQKDFNEIGRDAHFLRSAISFNRMEPAAFVGGGIRLSAGNEIRVQNTLNHFREGEMTECPAHMAIGIAILKPTDQDMVEPGSRNEPQLSDS